jgi:hypothetical protein
MKRHRAVTTSVSVLLFVAGIVLILVGFWVYGVALGDVGEQSNAQMVWAGRGILAVGAFLSIVATFRMRARLFY